MMRIFSRLGLLAFLALLASCGTRDPEVITPPKDVAAVVEPFLKALRNGQKAEAGTYVAAGARDELELQFGRDHVLLAQGPALKPRLIEERGSVDTKQVVIAYAGHQNGKWTSATVRAARPDAKSAYKVEYWRVTNRPPLLAMGPDALAETRAEARQMRLIFWGIVTLLGATVLGLLGWAFRNRTRPDEQSGDQDRRPSALTTRD